MTTHEVALLPLDAVYDDPLFNCRQTALQRGDVLDLIESIKRTRLESPIIVQPVSEIVVITPVPPGVEYRVCNGNRRFTAVRCLHKECPEDPRYFTIPAIIRTGLTDDAARALNITDNLRHMKLNLLQESKALETWYRLGKSREWVASQLDQSSSWVQIRFNLLELPADLQEYAARGIIGQDDVKDLYQYRGNIDTLYARAREIIQYRLNGRKPPRTRSKRQQARAKRPGRARTRAEMEEMLMHLGENIGAGLITRVLAWAAGNVSTYELLPEIRDTAKALGREYIPLDEDKLSAL